MDASNLFRPSKIRRLSKDETIALYRRHMEAQYERAEKLAEQLESVQERHDAIVRERTIWQDECRLLRGQLETVVSALHELDVQAMSDYDADLVRRALKKQESAIRSSTGFITPQGREEATRVMTENTDLIEHFPAG